MRTKIIGLSDCKGCGTRNDFSFYDLGIIPDETSLSLQKQRFYFECRKCGRKNFLSWEKIPVKMREESIA